MLHVPILLIHGFNGWPENWKGPADRYAAVDGHSLAVGIGRRVSRVVRERILEILTA